MFLTCCILTIKSSSPVLDIKPLSNYRSFPNPSHFRVKTSDESLDNWGGYNRVALDYQKHSLGHHSAAAPVKTKNRSRNPHTNVIRNESKNIVSDWKIESLFTSSGKVVTVFCFVNFLYLISLSLFFLCFRHRP